jgi:hypothetical protein
MLDRRSLLLKAAATATGSIAAKTALAANSIPQGPPLPSRDWNNSNPTVPYPDPNVQVLDPRFKNTLQGPHCCGENGRVQIGPKARPGSEICTA